MRKYDSGWRDERLAEWHASHGLSYPITGMPFLTIEYDRGKPVGLVNYINRDAQLPHGPDIALAYRAVGSLASEDGSVLPFITARYDNAVWAYQLYAHNLAAENLLRQVSPSGVAEGTEEEFASVLYAMRGKSLPDLSRWDVEFTAAPWHRGFEPSQDEEPWPGSTVSGRRRAFEPEGPAPFSVRIPCTDIDLAVTDHTGSLNLVVDYKLGDARVDPKSSSLGALGQLRQVSGMQVPAMVVRYIPSRDTCPPETECAGAHEWMFSVYCLNQGARNELAYRLGELGDTDRLSAVVAGAEWTGLAEAEWLALVNGLRGRA